MKQKNLYFKIYLLDDTQFFIRYDLRSVMINYTNLTENAISAKRIDL